jgi:hypothetical protein
MLALLLPSQSNIYEIGSEYPNIPNLAGLDIRGGAAEWNLPGTCTSKRLVSQCFSR